VFSLAISGSDTSGTLSYGAVGLPAGLKINTSSGAITGSVALGDAANGPYTVTILGGDGRLQHRDDVCLGINSPITIAQPATQTTVEGGTVSLSISASDTSGTFDVCGAGPAGGAEDQHEHGRHHGTVATGGSGERPLCRDRASQRRQQQCHGDV